jgi:DNA mismatch repair protein MutH
MEGDALSDLVSRARSLAGMPVGELAQRLGMEVGAGVHAKGKVGTLLEHALGATGGPVATWDFPDLKVELKTIPVGEDGTPRESTFVCAVSLLDADRAEWEGSWVRAKLARVLWVPVITVTGQDGGRLIGHARLWSPTAEQEGVLRDDYDEIMGRIGAGGIEMLSARVGRWLQLRPKAADGAARTMAPGVDGELVATVPRGFYLRALFTGAILARADAMP